jgi:hypothetical protein
MKIIIITSLLVLHCSLTYALDFNSYLNKAKSKVEELMGKKKVQKKVVPEVELPKFPEIIRDAKSLQVYKKKGTIHTQGHSFNKLSLEKKRHYRLGFLRELHFVVNGSQAEKSTLISNLNVLESGGSREGIYRSIVLSNEYSSLEGFSEVPSKGLLEYSVRFGQKFLKRKFNQELMKKLNLYGIKKVITEKVLELIDAFPSDGEDLYKWYAVFSADFSREFSASAKGKVRSRKSALFHLAWAKTVPLQQIKSEVIVKIHMAMNSLQK